MGTNRIEFGALLTCLALASVCVACGSDSNSTQGTAAGSSGGGAAGAGNSGGSGKAGAGGGGAASGQSGAGGAASGGKGGSAGKGGAGGVPGTSGSSGLAGESGAAGSGTVSAQFMPIVAGFCAAARACCAKDGVEMMLTDCETAFASRQVALASVEQGTVEVDSAALARCKAAYQQAASACDQSAVINGCQGVFLGTKNENEPCNNSYECKRDQGPMTCLFVDNATPGACKKVPHGKSGDACTSTCRTGDDCSSQTYGAADFNLTMCFEADGLYCDYLGDSVVCKPLVALGGDCSTSDACGTLGVCDTTCKASGGLHAPCGAGCRHDLQCIADQCEEPSLTIGSSCLGYPPAP